MLLGDMKWGPGLVRIIEPLDQAWQEFLRTHNLRIIAGSGNSDFGVNVGISFKELG